jgi:hypothetical protein
MGEGEGGGGPYEDLLFPLPFIPSREGEGSSFFDFVFSIMDSLVNVADL